MLIDFYTMVEFCEKEGFKFVVVECVRCGKKTVIPYKIKYAICDHCNALIPLNQRDIRKINEYINDDVRSSNFEFIIKLKKEIYKRW